MSPPEKVRPISSIQAGANGAAGIDAEARAPELDDGQIVFVVDTLYAGEVEQARAVLPRLEREAVRSFARRMLEDHEPAREALLRLARDQGIDPAFNDVAVALRETNARLVAQLHQTPPENLDAVYVDAQLLAHTQALALLQSLIGATASPVLRAQLTELTEDLELDLSVVRTLQDSSPS